MSKFRTIKSSASYVIMQQRSISVPLGACRLNGVPLTLESFNVSRRRVDALKFRTASSHLHHPMPELSGDTPKNAFPRKETVTESASPEISFRSIPSFLLGLGGMAFTMGMGDGSGSLDFGSVLKAISILTIVVAVHEAGHFIAARLQNIHVSKFAIGFGPKLIEYQGKVVEYSIRALPLGGFVAFPDDDPDCPYSEDDPNLLRNRPIRDRAWVVSAGVIANVIFAFFILLTQASTVGIQTEALEPGVVVPKILPKSAAQRAGIEAGDIILGIGDRQTAPRLVSVQSIVDIIETHPNDEISLLIQRKGERQIVKATPTAGKDGVGHLGMQLVAKRKLTTHVAKNPIEAIGLASREFFHLGNEILRGLQQLVFNFSKSADQVSGPIAIVAMGAEVARFNDPQLYLFAAVINLNLAVVNTLPLPALDGGYFVLLILEAIRGGKKLPQSIEQSVMASGILLFMALGCILIVRDTVHLTDGL